MRKNIKTCIYAVTAILPVILSACSNKADDTNTPKSVKEGTTTFVEDISSDITSSHIENTTEEDTTELISETEQETLNSEDITSQQEVQTDIQQITTVTSVNSTPAPVQTTPRPTETDQTTPRLTETTPRPTETTTPIENTMPIELYKIKDVIGFEKYSYNGLNFSIRFYFNSDSSITLDIFDFEYGGNFISPETENIPISIVYFKYDVYDSDGNCVKTDFCKVETNSYSCFAIIDIRDLPSTGYTIKLSNYQ